jgi:molecular chaperone DnaK (HSP70)
MEQSNKIIDKIRLLKIEIKKKDNEIIQIKNNNNAKYSHLITEIKNKNETIKILEDENKILNEDIIYLSEELKKNKKDEDITDKNNLEIIKKLKNNFSEVLENINNKILEYKMNEEEYKRKIKSLEDKIKDLNIYIENIETFINE